MPVVFFSIKWILLYHSLYNYNSVTYGEFFIAVTMLK